MRGSCGGIWTAQLTPNRVRLLKFVKHVPRVEALLIGSAIRSAVEREIVEFRQSRLANLVQATGPYAIKFVNTRWASQYVTPSPLKISDTPLQTWGTATYVTPMAFPLSSALYGRIGLVTDFNPNGWRVFDATKPSARLAYVSWVRTQAAFSELVLTVHSTRANQFLRNKFRYDFNIDCVLFNPDQEAEIHTDRGQHVWMAVTDWADRGQIDCTMSGRLANARFTVLLDEDFLLEENGLPIRSAERRIERVTETILNHSCLEVGSARLDPRLPQHVVMHYTSGAYLHVFIKP
jgi:hypothetical protein